MTRVSRLLSAPWRRSGPDAISDTGAPPGPAPRLSVVVVVYDMPDQAERTLRSLAPDYQRGVRAEDYEVIVVENRGPRVLGPERALRHGGRVRHLLREEPRATPVPAAGAGIALARAPHVALMIDGARMLTPGILRWTLAAFGADPGAIVSAPGYHLGARPQQQSVNEGHDEAEDARLLGGIGWPSDGYRLFEIGVWSGSCARGFFGAHGESNYLAAPAGIWDRIGGLDPRYDDLGGGKANHDLYKRMIERSGAELYLLHGEGSFHQVHGGITTNTPAERRREVMRAVKEQDARIRGADTAPPDAAPVLLGPLHPAVMPFVARSLEAQREAARDRAG